MALYSLISFRSGNCTLWMAPSTLPSAGYGHAFRVCVESILVFHVWVTLVSLSANAFDRKAVESSQASTCQQAGSRTARQDLRVEGLQVPKGPVRVLRNSL